MNTHIQRQDRASLNICCGCIKENRNNALLYWEKRYRRNLQDYSLRFKQVPTYTSCYLCLAIVCLDLNSNANKSRMLVLDVILNSVKVYHHKTAKSNYTLKTTLNLVNNMAYKAHTSTTSVATFCSLIINTVPLRL